MRAAALAVALLLLAGCSGGQVTLKPRPSTTTIVGSNGSTTHVVVGGTGTATGHPLATMKSWPDLEDAKIRPGAQVVVGNLACTANFLFRSPDNVTLYLGVAAHCFGLDASTAKSIGTTASVGGVRDAGKIVYNGWKFDTSDANDFGLIQLSNAPAVRNLVHPAMMYYGGPIGLGSSDDVGTNDRVMSYGHSIQRADDSPDNPRDGVVITHANDLLGVVTNHPGMPGDSGAGLMTTEGQAIGLLSTGVLPETGLPLSSNLQVLNNYVELDTALAAMADNKPTLAHLELVTWELIHGPDLPEVTLDGPVLTAPQQLL